MEVLGSAAGAGSGGAAAAEAHKFCLEANEAILHRVATGRPFSVLKYAMTLDGKIACKTGHSYWVSCGESRQVSHLISRLLNLTGVAPLGRRVPPGAEFNIVRLNI